MKQGGEMPPAREELLTPCHHPRHEMGQGRSCHTLESVLRALSWDRARCHTGDSGCAKPAGTVASPQWDEALNHLSPK